MTVYIMGNSHTGALRTGYAERGKGEIDFKIFPLGSGANEAGPFSAVEDGQVVFSDESFAKEADRYTGKSTIDDRHIWGLVMGTHTTRLFRRNFWRKAAPSSIAAPGVRPISKAVLDEIIDNDQKYVKEFALQLKRAGVSFFFISCPPVRRDGNVSAAGTPLRTLREVDGRARERFTDWLLEQKIPFVSPPKEVHDYEGFLKPIYSREYTKSGLRDPHHANGDYGILMLENIERFISKNYPSAKLRAQ